MDAKRISSSEATVKTAILIINMSPHYDLDLEEAQQSLHTTILIWLTTYINVTSLVT